MNLLGDPTLPVASYPRMTQEATRFMLACYNMPGNTMTAARVESWKMKMRKTTLEQPKLCSLPPTDAAFHENVLRAHFQLATWRSALQTDPPALDATDHGWTCIEGSTKLIPTVVPLDTPLAPKELLKVLKCGCASNTPCATNRCACKAQGVSCTLFCTCKGDDPCGNKA